MYISDEVIQDGKYRSMNIKELTLNDKLSSIGQLAFYDNKIEQIILPNSIKEIKAYAFYKNNIKEVTIPDNIELIEDYAFDYSTTIIYKNNEFKSSFISKYGISNIIKITSILNFISFEQINKFFTKEIIEVIPINNDAIKSYITYRKNFYEIISEIEKGYDIIMTEKQKASFYKMFYVFGFFNLNIQEKVARIIIKFCKLYNINDINDIFSSINVNEIHPKLSYLILDNYSDPIIPYFVIRYYNMFKQVSNTIKRKKKELLRKKSTRIIRLKENGNDSSLLEEEYRKELNQVKKITLKDVIDYVNNNNFHVKNKRLEKIVVLLSSYVNSDDFEKLEELYEISENIDDEEYFINLSEERNDSKKKYYAFLAKTDPTNLILGYLCDCCFKYGDDGEDILVQSITNSCIKNLVIYDGYKRIVAKSTVYYNVNNKSIVLNELCVCKSFMDKSSKNEKLEIIKSLLKGIKDEIEVMKNNGYDVNEARIELCNNKLKDMFIQLYGLTHQILPNYPYKCEIKDNSVGQSILYKRSSYELSSRIRKNN